MFKTLMAIVLALCSTGTVYAQCANGRCNRSVASFLEPGQPVRNVVKAPVVVVGKVAKGTAVVVGKAAKGAAVVTGKVAKGAAVVTRKAVKVTTAPVRYVVKCKPVRRVLFHRRCN